MRKLKPFTDFKGLTPEQFATVHDRLANSTLHKTIAFLREEFGLAISYGRLQRYYHRWQQAEQIKAQSGVNISVNELIAIQNGENIPLAPIAHHLILKTACIQAGSGENKPAELLTLQRIANNQFNQDLAKAKHELERRKQNFRAQVIAQKRMAENKPTEPADDLSPQTTNAQSHAPGQPTDPGTSTTPRPGNIPPNVIPIPSAPSARPASEALPRPSAQFANGLPNPPSFELRTLTEAPYIRDYPEISSFGKGPVAARRAAIQTAL